MLRTDAIELAALQEQRHAVPIVFTQVTDPVGEGLVLNLAHPGGHLTGFTSFDCGHQFETAEYLRFDATSNARRKISPLPSLVT